MKDYIKVSDVKNIVEKYSYSVVIDLWLRKDIDSLPTHNPIQEVLDMIDEMEKEKENIGLDKALKSRWDETVRQLIIKDIKIWILRELKEKILKLNPN